jgi:hypothetical protein
MKRNIILVAVAAVVVIATWKGIGSVQERLDRQARIREAEEVTVPKAEPRPSSSSSSQVAAQPPASQPAVPAQTRDEVNWDVPFTPQAPFANWDAVHGEACEEASAFMVLRYFAGQKIASPQDAEDGILHLIDASGPAVDETAQEIADLIESENPSLHADILKDPTEASMKAALAEGKLIIVPAAGRQLGNPFFQTPGPPYHMLVLRGYTKDGHVITNDPGTKRGENFAYTWTTLINAIHDWNGGDVENGAKVVIVIGE